MYVVPSMKSYNISRSIIDSLTANTYKPYVVQRNGCSTQHQPVTEDMYALVNRTLPHTHPEVQ